MSTSATAAPATGSRRPPDWAVLALLCLGQAMVILDVSIVNVALPSIRGDLGFSASGLPWVVNAYALTWAGLLLLGGRAGDFFGHRRLFTIGLVVFTVASLVGGLAQDQATLVIARAVQGVGGALLSPVTLTILMTTFTEGKRRARAMAAWTAVSGGGAAVGSVLGGVITDLLNWRWVLFVNVPLGIVAVIGAFTLLRESRTGQAARDLDLLGGLLVTAGLTGVVYGTVNSTPYGWTAVGTLVPLVVGAVLLLWFAFHEGRFARFPVVPLRMLRVRSVGLSNLVMFWIGCAVIAHFYFLTLYLQNVLHYSPLAAGLAFLPGAATMVAGAQLGQPLVGILGTRGLLIGSSVVSGGGLLWLAYVPDHGSYPAHLLVPMMLVTLGAGLMLTPLALSATSGIAPSEAGLASGLINTTRQVGGSIGLAVLATVAADRTQAAAPSGPIHSQVSGYHAAFLVGAAFALAAAVTSLAVPPVTVPSGPPPGGEPTPVPTEGEAPAIAAPTADADTRPVDAAPSVADPDPTANGRPTAHPAAKGVARPGEASAD